MALRFLLVSLVAGLGIDLPSGDEFSSWARSGQEWVQARLDGFRGVDPDSNFEAEQADSDFAAVVDDMAGNFAADLASLERPRPATMLASVSLEVPEDEIVEGEAVDDRSESLPASEVAAIDDGEAEELTAPAAPARSTRSTRIASAVQLTKQAADAWMSVLRNDEGGPLGQ
jgi:hypothetical protein